VLAWVLSRASRTPSRIAATESWPPNVELARRRLGPFGVTVAEAADEAVLPFGDGSFDLVVSRHPVVTRWTELARVLRPGGAFLSQQIGAGSNRELYEFMTGPQPASDLRSPARAAAQARVAGLEVTDLRSEALRVEFNDVGAVVHFLRRPGSRAEPTGLRSRSQGRSGWVERVSSAGSGNRVVIVGGGIAGLAAAFFLREHHVDVTVLEGSPSVGGKLAVSEVAGISVDAGAEALLARRPEGVGLIEQLGLAGQQEYPGTTAASIWSRGQFRSLPRRQFMGVPADFDDLERSGIISPAGLDRARQDATIPGTPRDGDVSVADYVGGRFGSEVVDRLVEPLLGGVYAGRADQLSFDATLPGLAQAAHKYASLAEAAAALLPPAAPSTGSAAPPPVFTTLAGGLGTLPQALARASGAVVRTKATVRGLTRTPGGWRLSVGPAVAPEAIDADAVILALPARPASRLVRPIDGAASAAAGLAEIEYASMAIVTLAYPTAAFPEPITGSGYLVPAVDLRPVKAVTFSTVKWPHLAAGEADHGIALVRCSLGRVGEEAVLQRDDAELAALAAADLTAATGVTGRPVDTRVTRWGGALPQYTVGHLDRVSAIRAAIAAQPGLAVCGAAFDGVGIPACVASARLAVDQVLGYLAARSRPGAGE
jgi:oxygen-dependent protoporphyrinogen oxidase